MERKNVRMLKIRRRLDLGQKPLGPNDSGELGAKNFYGDISFVLEVAGEVNCRHASSAKLSLDAISVADGGVEAADLVRHITGRVQDGANL